VTEWGTKSEIASETKLRPRNDTAGGHCKGFSFVTASEAKQSQELLRMMSRSCTRRKPIEGMSTMVLAVEKVYNVDVAVLM
jgi:hypothetical protein